MQVQGNYICKVLPEFFINFEILYGYISSLYVTLKVHFYWKYNMGSPPIFMEHKTRDPNNTFQSEVDSWCTAVAWAS